MQVYRKRKLFFKDHFFCYIINGSKGAGKSTLVEHILEYFLRKNCLVFDFWAAGNFENCFWSVPGKADPKRHDDKRARTIGYPVLIVHPETTVIQQNDALCTCGHNERQHGNKRLSCLGYDIYPIKCKQFVSLIKTITDDVPLDEMVKSILAENRKYHRVIVFNEAFYNEPKDAYKAMAKLLKQYPMLIKRQVIPDTMSCAIGFRELGDLVTGGVKAIAGPYQTETRRHIQTLVRKCRHWRTNVIVDAQRNDDIAAAVSDQKDYWFIKQATDDLIPEKYQWAPKKIELKHAYSMANGDDNQIGSWPMVNKLQKWQVYVIHPDNYIELRSFPMPRFMHKGEKDSWQRLANVTVLYGEKAQVKKLESKAKAIKEKADQIKQLEEVLEEAIRRHDEEGHSWPQIAKDLGYLSPSTGAPSGDKLKLDVSRYKKKLAGEGV